MGSEMCIRDRLRPIGVTGAADFSLSKKGFPLNVVTVRVFTFKDAEHCKAWWKKKYEVDGWEEHYEKVKCDGTVCVRSIKTNKTALAFGNVWLTTHQLQKDGKEHLTAANHVLKLMTSGKKQIGDSKESEQTTASDD